MASHNSLFVPFARGRPLCAALARGGFNESQRPHDERSRLHRWIAGITFAYRPLSYVYANCSMEEMLWSMWRTC